MGPRSHIASDSDLESVISTQERQPKRRRTSTGPKYFCTIEGCQAVFKRLDHLDRHEYKHTGIKKHSCTYEGCDKTYSIVTHLKRHLRCTHERKEAPTKTVPCIIESCSKMFQSACNMQRHIREVHEKPKIYHCAYCGEKFTQRLKMRRHEINKHTKEYPFKCSKCGKGFYQEWQYERHLTNCKTYPCSNCTLTFDKWSMYIKHCKEARHGGKYYKCEMCTRAYGKPGELQNHIASKHLDDELKVTFKCTYEGCTRSYVYKRNLRQHMRTAHSGMRFDCTATEECTHVFSSAQNLKMHLKRDHGTGVKKASCKSAARTKQRRKRKDAGQMLSNLAKLSGLAVNKDLDKLLREREETALAEVTAKLGEIQNREDEEIVNADGVVREEEENVGNKEKLVNEGEKNTEEFTDVNQIEKCGNKVSDSLEADEELEVEKLIATAFTILAKLDTI